jgi:hypothetical protein
MCHFQHDPQGCHQFGMHKLVVAEQQKQPGKRDNALAG